MIIMSIGLVFYFFTLQSFQQIEIARMKWDGISSIETPRFHYFEKNNCSDNKSCQCVLLLHGLGDFALTWRKMLSENKASYVKDLHFFAPNLPGALSTPKLKDQKDYNVQNLARLVENEFIPKCNSWVVVGNSYGGWMSVFLGLDNEKIKGLLLLAPAGLKKDYSFLTDYFLHPTIQGARNFYNKIYYNPKDLPDILFRRVVERLESQPVVDQLKAITDQDYIEPYLPELKIPVWYLWGDADGVIPMEWSGEYTNLTAQNSLRVIKSVGMSLKKNAQMKL